MEGNIPKAFIASQGLDILEIKILFAHERWDPLRAGGRGAGAKSFLTRTDVSLPASDLRVLIVAEHASTKFGGEAILPFHYFRGLRRRGVEVWLVVHARTRDELIALLPGDADRMHFIPDSWFHKLACRLSCLLPTRLSSITFGFALRLTCQVSARRVVRRLIARHRVDVIHQPIPVSPKEPSLMYGLGVPVVIGPMNGGMDYPPGFAQMDGLVSSLSVTLGRKVSTVLNRLMPGKLQAVALLVANERTRRALPQGARGEVIKLVENGVDLSVYGPRESLRPHDGSTRFIFVGRLVDWKCVDLLLEAFRVVVSRTSATLEVLGDGPMRGSLEALAGALGVAGVVIFKGWLTQAECARRIREADVLVLPSIYECGGAVVLEAMACGLPVVATNWGGPADYLDGSCGILVDPVSREGFIEGLSEAMTRLAESLSLREAMGRAGRERVIREFDWDLKVDRMLEIYERVTMASRPPQA